MGPHSPELEALNMGEYRLVWVLNFDQFTEWITSNNLPSVISFDHDLAEEHYTPAYFWDNYKGSKKFQDWKSKTYKEKTGRDCAKWLVDYCIKTGRKMPRIYVHSANPVGADNIRAVIAEFLDANPLVSYPQV